MMTLLRWVLNVAALMVVPSVITSIEVNNVPSAIIAAIIIGLLNLIVRPLLLLLTLPITILTLGLFMLVINALLFWLAASLVPGFDVPDFWSALGGAILYSVLTWLVDIVLGNKQPH